MLFLNAYRVLRGQRGHHGAHKAIGRGGKDLGHGALLAALGIGIGLAGALAVTRFLRAMLFGVSPFDPVSFVAVTLVLGTIAFLASYVPARRAARVDPIEALREE